MAVVAVLLCAGVVAFCLIFFLQYKWRYRHILSQANKLPCPKTQPFLGNSILLIRGLKQLPKLIIGLTNQFKDVFCVWVSVFPVFVVSNPADVQIVLNSSTTLEKDNVYKFLKPFLGNGLLTAPVPIWKKYRRLLLPMHHPVQIEKYLDVFNNVSRQLTQRFVDNPVIDPRKGIFHTAVDAAMLTVMGQKATLSDETKNKIDFMFGEVGRVFMARCSMVWLHVEWVYRLLYRKKAAQLTKITYECEKLYDDILKELVEERKLKEISEPEDKPEPNMVTMVLGYPEDKTEDHTWWDEIATMLTGAIDTTVSTVSFCLLTLANYPDIQTKIREEIRDVMGDSNRDVTAKDIESMTYLEQVLMENMRLHGVFAIILRQATKDTKLTTTTLPAGSRIVIPLHAMGWNEDIFPEPHKFLPERFSPENSSARHKYSFIPFSGGPRNCLGKKYAIFLMKTVMVHILRTFEIRTKVTLDDIEYEVKMIMFNNTPIPLEFVPL